MSQSTTPVPPPTPLGANPSAPFSWGRYAALFVCAALVTVINIQQCFAVGRMAADQPLYDDVAYFIDALECLRRFEEGGISALVQAHWTSQHHSPWSTYAALAGYMLFGEKLWAPFAINVLPVFLILVIIDSMLRQSSTWIRAAVSAVFLTMPFTTALVVECRPDPFNALLTAYGLWMLAVTPTHSLRRSQAIWVGVVWGATMWVKPSVFAQTALFFLLALAWGWLGAWSMRPRPWRQLVHNTSWCVASAALVGAPHILPHLRHYLGYMKQHMFSAGREFWVLRAGAAQHSAYYTVGEGGGFMFGNTFLILVGLVAATLMIARWRGASELFRQTVALSAFCFVCWLMPTVNPVKSAFFGMVFGCLLLFAALRCLAGWLGNELGLKRRWTMPVGAAGVVVLCAFWQLPSFARHDSGVREPAEAVRAVYEELRNHMPHGERTRIVMATAGHLNDYVLRWHFLARRGTVPNLTSVHLATSWHEVARILERADVVVVPEVGVPSPLVYDFNLLNRFHKEVFDRMVQDDRYRLCGAIPLRPERRVLVFERHGPFVGWAADSGLHIGAKKAIAVQPVFRIRLPRESQQAARLALKVRSMAPGQRLIIRTGQQQELARLELREAGAWREETLPLEFHQPTSELEFVCLPAPASQSPLEFEELRVEPARGQDVDPPHERRSDDSL